MRPGPTSKPRTNLWITRRRRPTSRHGGRIRRSCSYQGPRQGRSRALRRCCSYEGPGQPENRRNGGSVSGERRRCPHNRSNGGTAHPVPGVCYGFLEDAYADGNTIALDGPAARRTSPPRPTAAGRTAAAWRLRLLRHQLRGERGVDRWSHIGPASATAASCMPGTWCARRQQRTGGTAGCPADRDAAPLRRLDAGGADPRQRAAAPGRTVGRAGPAHDQTGVSGRSPATGVDGSGRDAPGRTARR